MTNISCNNTAFKGWECNERLCGKINNERELKELANVSKVDKIRTTIGNESKYLPNDDIYLTVATKKAGGQLYQGIDCIILPKDSDTEKISQNIFKSAQKAIGELFGKIAKQNTEKTQANKASTGILKHFFKIFKNGLRH